MAVFGYAWLFTAVYGNVTGYAWLCRDIHGCVWQCRAMYSCVGLCDQVHSSLFYFTLFYFPSQICWNGNKGSGVVIFVSHTQTTAMSFGPISGHNC